MQPDISNLIINSSLETMMCKPKLDYPQFKSIALLTLEHSTNLQDFEWIKRYTDYLHNTFKTQEIKYLKVLIDNKIDNLKSLEF